MNTIKSALRYILTIHVTALLFLTLFRLVLLFTNMNNISDQNVEMSWIFTALFRGIWFDNVIACYISVLPLVTLSIFGLFNVFNKWLVRAFNCYYIILFGLVFAISVSDVPYFNYFFKHLNSSIFNWKEEGGNAMQMIFQESSYYVYFILFILSLLLFAYIVIKVGKIVLKSDKKKLYKQQYLIYSPVCIILVGLCFLGIRGRLGRNPIKTSQAYFCNNSFLNQLGLDPTFFLMRSIIENSKKHISVDSLMTQEEAISSVQKELNVVIDETVTSPVFRKVGGVEENKNINVVFVLMESMSADLLTLKNGSLTPYLNSLIKESYYFDNFYSAGNHTNQGIAATLFGLPSLFDKNMMKDVDIAKCYGIPNVLQERGYHTMFFVTHESQYDNMNAFLLENGIERMYAQEDYPSSKIVNGFGVQDDFLFEYAIKTLDEQSQKEKPFFATILTISNHPPYVVPDKFKIVSKNPSEQIVAFADDAVSQFMTAAKKTEWYKNTIFVFLGDHGKIVGNSIYDMPLSYNHIPLIIHSPMFKDVPRVINNLGGQVDVFPTVMGLLDYVFDNNTLGEDILKNERPYMFFTSDDMMGCINDQFFYIYNPTTKNEGLFDYRNNNTINEKKSHVSLVDSMRNYAASMLITTDYMLKNKLTSLK